MSSIEWKSPEAKDPPLVQSTLSLDAHSLVGKRALLQVKQSQVFASPIDGVVEEYLILEASPSGQFIRLQNANGNKFWRFVGLVQFVEELRPIVRRPSAWVAYSDPKDPPVLDTDDRRPT